ncbi:MAG: VOC family protein [Cyanothece sp. SIO1E1]|nr:VOC family protein [Cyanothece sp. SIO1E1]
MNQPLSTYFHVGIIVKDLEQGMRDYSQLMGLTWTTPNIFEIPILEDPKPHAHELLAVFSREGPPYYELIQASGAGIFSVKYCDCIHYVGIYDADIPARIAAFRTANHSIDATLKNSAGEPFGLVTAPGSLGIRLEYVDLSARPAIEEWVQTGIFPGKVAE